MIKRKSPSLLEPESAGGEWSDRGSDFEDNVILYHIPRLLSMSGFQALIRQALGDVEVAIFTPEYGIRYEFLEIKNYKLNKAAFWKEIKRFRSVAEGTDNIFPWFRLVIPDLLDSLRPLINSLRRLRSPYGFYNLDNPIYQNSLDDYRNLVKSLGQNDDMADFLFQYVYLEVGSASQSNGFELFMGELLREFPEYRNFGYEVYKNIYYSLKTLIKSINIPISRQAVEESIDIAIAGLHQLSPRSAQIHCLSSNEKDVSPKPLIIDLQKFSTKQPETFPSIAEWNLEVTQKLIRTRDFIQATYKNRKVSITGSKRLSVALTIGAVFSAVQGFTVEMEYREGVWWSTNNYQEQVQKIDLEIALPKTKGSDLIVALGIGSDISSSVRSYWNTIGGSDSIPLLEVTFHQPLTSASQINIIVTRIKQLLLESLDLSQAKTIHLFCKCPAFFALFLGHRLNAIAPIQCYEYISPSLYLPSTLLSITT